MISKGVQSQIISRKVGHSSVQITDKIYSHFFEDEFKAVANVMDEFYLVHTKIEEILFASIYLMPSFYHIEFLNFFYFYWVVHKFYQAIQKK